MSLNDGFRSASQAHPFTSSNDDAAVIGDRHAIRIVGAGSRPIVFSHGFGCDQNMWRAIVPAFDASKLCSFKIHKTTDVRIVSLRFSADYSARHCTAPYLFSEQCLFFCWPVTPNC